MKKRTLAVVLSLVMALALGVTAMAAPSKTVAGIVDDVTATDADDKDVDIIVTELPDEYKDEVENLKDKDVMKDVLGDGFVDSMVVLDAVDLAVVGDEELIKWPVTIKFQIAGVVSDTVISLVQWNGEKWVVVPAKVGKGYVEATIDEIAPVAFIVDKDTLEPKSDKTGDVTTAVAMMVVLAAGALVVMGKKEFVR